MKRWVRVFRAFANENRLNIVKFLSENGAKSVTDIAEHLGISLKATSRHLILLETLDILRGKGRDGHVFYSLSTTVPDDIRRVMNVFL